MKHFLIAVLLLFACNGVYSQKNGSSTASYAHNKLPVIDAGWEKFSNAALSDIDYSRFKEDPNYELSDLSSYFFPLKAAFNTIYKSKELSGIFYEWAIVIIKKKWSQLSVHDKSAYLDLLKHASEYLSKFSLEDEKKHFEACLKVPTVIKYEPHYQLFRGVSGESCFTRYAKSDFFDNDYTKPFPESCHSPFRRIETFFYRRALDGAEVNLMRSAIDRLISDLKFSADMKVNSKDKNGQMIESATVAKGKKEGVWKFYKNVEFNKKNIHFLADSGMYKNDRKEGLWMHYVIEEGQRVPFLKINYQNGQIITRTYYNFWSGKQGMILTTEIHIDFSNRTCYYKDYDSKTASLVTVYNGKMD